MVFRYLTLIIELVVAVYLLLCAASGKSKMFASPFTKEDKVAVYKKTARTGFMVLGVIVLLLTVLNTMAVFAEENSARWMTLTNISTGLSVVVLTVLLALFYMLRRLQNTAKRKEPARHVAPRSAFYFDDEQDAASASAPSTEGAAKSAKKPTKK